MTSLIVPLAMLVTANVFMTFAWYGHLGRFEGRPIWIVILASWGIAFFEYCLQVPANRLAFGQLNLVQLKVTQEVITMVVFMVFATTYMKRPFSTDLLIASVFLCLGAYFAFRSGLPTGGAT